MFSKLFGQSPYQKFMRDNPQWVSFGDPGPQPTNSAQVWDRASGYLVGYFSNGRGLSFNTDSAIFHPSAKSPSAWTEILKHAKR